MSTARDPTVRDPTVRDPAANGGVGTLVPLRLLAIPMGAGLVAEVMGWWVITLGAPLHAGWYGWPVLLLGVHMVVIGGLLWPVLGAGWQLTPVVTATPLPGWAGSFARRIGPLGVVGALLLWVGMASWPWAGAVGAALVIVVLVLRSTVVTTLLVQARGRIGVRAWLLASEAALWAGLFYAAALYAGRLGHPVLPDPIGGIGHHVGLLAVGWIGGWEIGLGALLLPMFALGKEPRPGPMILSAAAWFGGVYAGAPWLWAVGALGAVGLLVRSVVQAQPRGPGLAQASAAILALGLLALATLTGVVIGPHVWVAAALTLWLLPLQHGVATRVAPFLMWAHLLAGRSDLAPSSLVDVRVGWAQLGASFAGGLLLVGGLSVEAEAVARAGTALLGIGATLHLVALGVAATRVFFAWRTAVALPGTITEAR